MKGITGLVLLFLSMTAIAQAPFVLSDTKNDHKSSIEVIIPTPDGKYLLSGDFSGNVYVWDLSNFSVIKKIKAHSATVNAILFNKDGSKFVTAGDDGKVKLWDFATRESLATFTAPYDRVNFAVLSPDEKSVYYGGYSSDIYNYSGTFSSLVKSPVSNPSTRKILFTSSSNGTTHGITDGIMDHQYQYVVLSAGYSVYFWDPETDKLVTALRTGYYVNNITSLPGIFLAWADGKLIRWDWNDALKKYEFTKMITSGDGGGVGYSRIMPSSDLKLIASGNDGTLVNIYDLETLSKKQVLAGHGDVVRAFAFVNKDTVLITAGYDNTLKIWMHPKEDKPEEEVVVEEEPVVIKDSIDPEPIAIIDTSVKFTTNNIPLKIKDRNVVKQATIPVSQGEVEVLLWDENKVDGDSISVNINGVWVLENYAVTKEKKSLHISLKPNTNNYLILYAHNLGEIPPNTAAMAVKVGDKEYKLSIESDLKSCGALNLEYKPE